MSDLVLGPETKKALAVARAERERRAGQRLWGVLMLARTVEVGQSIMHCRPVLVRNLDPEALRRALRGTAPPADEFIEITPEHLDAIAECGPQPPAARERHVRPERPHVLRLGGAGRERRSS